MGKALRRLTTNRLALIGAVGIMMVTLMALFSPALAPYNPTTMDTPHRFAPPGQYGHVFGTDEFGRDVLSRVIFGSRVSLLVAAVAVSIGTLAGGGIGVAAGFIGGWLDNVLMRLTDTLLAIPALMIALGIVGLLGPSAASVTLALGIAYSPWFARVIRSAVVSVRSQPYIEAARAMGVSSWRILTDDVLPNILPAVMVQATTSLAWGILDEASIGFLGLGVQPPTPSWGSLLATGRQYFYQSPTVPIFGGLAVLMAVFSVNLFGDGLRDLLDPRAWQRGE